MLIIPSRIDTVSYPNTPYVNISIIVLCTIMFLLTLNGIPKILIQDGWNPVGMFGSIFMHGGWLHLFFNMLFLWVFGNVICSNLENGKYLILFLFCGLISGIFQNIFDGRPSIGASGALNGIIGFYLAVYPTNKINLRYISFYPPLNGEFKIAGFWIIGFWFIGDLIGTFASTSNTAYWAHIGGFLGGLWAGFKS